MRRATLIPAAGASSRMRGADKLLEKVDGEALLPRQASAALAIGGRVIVTLRPGAGARRAALARLPVEIVEVADAGEGMAASLRAGARAAGEADALMVLLPDMPEITADDLSLLWAACERAGDAIVRAAARDGRPGHPVIFPARLFAAIGGLTGDTGARDLLKSERVLPCPLPDDRALVDLDTPEDWARWRAAPR